MSRKTWMDDFNDYRPRDEPVPEEPLPQRRRKDTKHWCRGKVGKAHTPEVVLNHSFSSRNGTCHEAQWSWMADRWVCHHSLKCTGCGKYVKTWLQREECPTWQEQNR